VFRDSTDNIEDVVNVLKEGKEGHQLEGEGATLVERLEGASVEARRPRY
jgi:hypothetical protein